MMVKVFLFARNRVRAMWPEQENTSSSFRGVNQPVYRIECIIKDLYTYRNSTEGQTPFETNKPGSGRKVFFFFFFGGGGRRRLYIKEIIWGKHRLKPRIQDLVGKADFFQGFT